MKTVVHYREIEGKSPAYWALLGFFGLFILVALACAYYMEHNGHYVTGMTNQIVWGMPHVFAVFLIVAASGALNVASIASVFGKHMYKPLGRLSGLLAIAAGKLGAKGIVAIDSDPVSVQASRVNAAINGVKLESLLDDAPPEQSFELVAANILAGPLIAMAPKLARCVGKRLVLSGLLRKQADIVTQAYVAAGLNLARTDILDEWVSVELDS